MSKIKIELNRAAVRELLRSGEVMGVLEAEARNRANALGHGYGVNTYVGRNRGNAEVAIVAETEDAIHDNLENNSLLRSIS